MESLFKTLLRVINKKQQRDYISLRKLETITLSPTKNWGDSRLETPVV